MLVIAHHNIKDPEHFWAAAKEITNSLPSTLHLHGVYPAKDGKTGTCLWESGSVDEVQQFLDQKAGKWANNFCYELNTAEAMGLPNVKLDAALAN